MFCSGPPGLHNYVIIDYITNTQLFNIDLRSDYDSFVNVSRLSFVDGAVRLWYILIYVIYELYRKNDPVFRIRKEVISWF